MLMQNNIVYYIKTTYNIILTCITVQNIQVIKTIHGGYNITKVKY